MIGVGQRRSAEPSQGPALVRVKPAVLRPGSQGEAHVHVHYSNASVKISVVSNHHEITVVDVAPAYGKTPFSSRILLYASFAVKPGVYYLDIAAADVKTGAHLAQVALPVFVVGNEQLAGVVRSIDKYRETYKKFGAQYTVLKAMYEHSLELTFAELKTLYSALLHRVVSDGTVCDLVSRLLKKGLLVKANGRYRANPKLDLETALTIIDVERAKNGLQGARASVEKHVRKEEPRFELPRDIRRLIEKASKLVERDYWKTVDLIAHTLIGVRETGTWLLWVEDYFIYKEEKTGFLHYFRSKQLAELLRNIGLREGFMADHVNSPARDLIRELYYSYANARRLHYTLKKLGWLEYGEPLILEVFNDTSNPYLAVKKLPTDETLVSVGKPCGDTKRYIVYPGEHVDLDNEETYFHRPSGLY